MSSSTGFRETACHVGHLALAAFVVAAAAGSATQATANAAEGPGTIGLRLVEEPAGASDDPRSRIYIVDHLAPGSVIERQVEVSNSTSSTHPIALYSSAATIEDGLFIGGEGDTPNELSRWTTVTPGTMDIAAGEKLTAVVRIAVPADAAPGEQYGVVWAEVRSDAVSGGVTQVSRVGIRLYVSVGRGGAPAPDFTVASLTPSRSAEGEPVITATVRNIGGRALDVTGGLMLTGGPGGLSAGPFPAELHITLTVGATEKIIITLDDRLPAGPWDAAVTLKSGVTERRGEATITFPAAGEAPAVATHADSGAGRPYVAGMVAAVMALGLAALHLLRRVWRRRATYLPRQWAPPGSLPASVNRNTIRGFDYSFCISRVDSHFASAMPSQALPVVDRQRER